MINSLLKLRVFPSCLLFYSVVLQSMVPHHMSMEPYHVACHFEPHVHVSPWAGIVQPFFPQGSRLGDICPCPFALSFAVIFSKSYAFHTVPIVTL